MGFKIKQKAFVFEKGFTLRMGIKVCGSSR